MAQRKPIQEDKQKIETASQGVELRLRAAIANLPPERALGLDVTKIHQRLLDSFYVYEAHVSNFVLDRDLPNIIYSLGFVPSQNEMNQLVLAMRYRPQSRTPEREEIDSDHNFVHIFDFADVIIPKLLADEYKSADEDFLLQCLTKFDENKKKILHKKFFIQTLSSMEDVFDEHEGNDLLNFLNTNENLNLNDFFNYKRYVKHLLPQRHLIYLNLSVTKEI